MAFFLLAHKHRQLKDIVLYYVFVCLLWNSLSLNEGAYNTIFTFLGELFLEGWRNISFHLIILKFCMRYRQYL